MQQSTSQSQEQVKDGELPKRDWRVRLELVSDPDKKIDLVLDEPIVFGTSQEVSGAKHIATHHPVRNGVSRRHARLWSTPAGLFVEDLGSTNGTWINDMPTESGIPQTVDDGDSISFGKLRYILRVIERPHAATRQLRQQFELIDALTGMATAITSELALDDVLDRALSMAMAATRAKEASLWLVDVQTNELFLEAERGIRDARIRRMRLPVSDPLVNEVLTNDKPLRTSRKPEGDLVKIKTGYLVEALMYVPLRFGDQMLGVIAVVHREPGKAFSPHDEKILTVLAGFVATAIHNSRLYERVLENDRMKGDIIQNISHELRTPLTYIVGYIGLILDEKEKLSDEHRTYLELVQLQTDRLVWLIRNAVALRSPDEIASRAGLTDVVETLRQAVAGTELEALKQSITVSLSVNGDLPPVAVNQMALMQVLDNLLSNALKFTPKGGRIELGAKRAPEGDHVIFSVSDTGIGISEEDQKRIFERFYQVSGGMSRQFTGVGLGLAVCKAIVEAYGGRIWVESAKGEGATFLFTVPVAEDEKQKVKASASESEPGMAQGEAAEPGKDPTKTDPKLKMSKTQPKMKMPDEVTDAARRAAKIEPPVDETKVEPEAKSEPEPPKAEAKAEPEPPAAETKVDLEPPKSEPVSKSGNAKKSP
jgi:signal transduction histidine kinase